MDNTSFYNPQDPKYSPAVQMVVSRTRELISKTPDTILCELYFHSINESIRCVALPDTRNVKKFLEKRLSHLNEMKSEIGESEVAKEFKNAIEAAILSSGEPGEKQLTSFLSSVATGIMEFAKITPIVDVPIDSDKKEVSNDNGA